MRQTNAVWLLFFAGVDCLQCLSMENVYHDNQWSINSVVDCIRIVLSYPMVLSILERVFHLLVPVLAFILFCIHNKSIVLGDKSNHQMTIHLAMVLHHFVLSALLISPVLVIKYAPCMRNITNIGKELLKVKHWMGVALCSFILLCSCHSHPFLLADNRSVCTYIHSIIRSFIHF